MNWKLVPVTKEDVFGMDLDIDEKKVLEVLSRYIGSLKDRYNPRTHIIKANLVLDESSMRIEKREQS